MSLEKKTLSLEEIEAQTAMELPDREMMALIDITIVTGDVVTIELRNVSVAAAANICAQIITSESVLDCNARASA